MENYQPIKESLLLRRKEIVERFDVLIVTNIRRCFAVSDNSIVIKR